MPQSPDNLDPKEATEARLCAYLEGEMPPAERIEIEKYLQSNPQHRQLLADLAKTRAMMVSLPREPAPPDIAEAFQGQLERSMLLDGGSETVAGVNRLPQTLLAAAIVLLAAGLGVVVYFTLPGTPPPKFTAYVPTPQTASAPAATNPVAAAPTASPLAAALKKEEEKPTPPPTEVASSKPLVSQAAAELNQSAAHLNDLVTKSKAATQPAPSSPQVAQNQLAGLEYKRDASAPTLRIVVSADDPSAAARAIQGDLAANHIPYESRLANNGQTAQKEKSSDASQLGVNGLKDHAMDQQQTAPPQQQDLAFQQQAATQPVGGTATTAPDELFVAHGLTRPQAEQVALSVRQAGRTAEVYDAVDAISSIKAIPATRPAAILAATTAPATAPADVIAKDQRLKVTVDQLVGPGMDKTNLVQVADDGTINLPMLIEPVRAAGLTPAELAKRIAAKYNEANLIPNATVHVDRIATVEVPAKAIGIAAATQAAAASATQPTTMPAAPVATPLAPASAEKIDLVILVQKRATPTTAPATQPTTAPALTK
jgi:hypothetical protein